MKREGELKSAFGTELKRLPGFYMFQIATAGWPDRGIVGAGRTTFWEFKHGTPDFDSPGNQELTCQRLALHGGWCRYVVWQENAKGVGQRTLIVHPREVAGRSNWNLQPESWCVGYDHRWLVNKIREAHRS